LRKGQSKGTKVERKVKAIVKASGRGRGSRTGGCGVFKGAKGSGGCADLSEGAGEVGRDRGKRKTRWEMEKL